jgi:hypothetical protein
MSPAEVAEVIAEGRERLTYEGGRARFRERLADRLATAVMGSARVGLDASPETVTSAVRQTREYQRLVTKCWPRVTPEQLLGMLFKNRRRLAETADGVLSAEEIDLLLAQPPPASASAMTHSEFALLDEARALIEPELRTFGHVVVDEAQNLTPMELRMVVRRARRQSLTVLGDIAQRTAEARLSSWEAVLGDAGVDRVAIEELLVSYRVPDDFLRIAATLHPEAAVPQGVRRAPWAAVAVTTEASRLGEVAAELAARMSTDVGSVGVIVPAAARSVVEATVGTATHETLSQGINVLGLDAIKGLEFDAAIVIEPQAILDERPDGGRGGLYTALTRSTRALAVLHTDPLPPDLAAAGDLHVVRDISPADAWAAHRRG